MQITKGLLKRIALWGLFLALGALALVGLLSVTRGTPVRRVVAIDRSRALPAVSDSTFARAVEVTAGIDLDPGNRVDLLENGDGTYPRLWADIDRAQHTLTVQWYYAQPGTMADSFATHVVARARAGVKVLLVMDAFGAQNLKDTAWDSTLVAAGVRLAWLRPVHWYSLHKANFRSHARALVVDGRVGYTGGYGLADYWWGDGRSPDQWRETNVRVEGPAVIQIQAAFAAAWAEATGELLSGDLFFPRIAPAADASMAVGLLYAMPTTGSTNAERFMALSIASARQRLWIANSYFVPDDDFRNLLTDAARRGVDVRILTAGEATDIKSTLWAGRARYQELLEVGVRVYEYKPTMMHSKTFVIDGLWSTVGSLNFDNRSLAFNNETNLVVLDRDFGARMERMFLEDLEHSDEITLAEHRKRGVRARIFETGANFLSRLL